MSRRTRLVAARVSHPLASYDRMDRLVCKACESVVDPLLWRMHLQRHETTEDSTNSDSDSNNSSGQPPVKRMKASNIGKQSDVDMNNDLLLNDLPGSSGNDRLSKSHVASDSDVAKSSKQNDRIDMDAEWEAFQTEIKLASLETVVNEVPNGLQTDADNDGSQDELHALAAEYISKIDHLDRLKKLRERAKALKTNTKQ